MLKRPDSREGLRQAGTTEESAGEPRKGESQE